MLVTDDGIPALRALLDADDRLYHEIRGRKRPRSGVSSMAFLTAAFVKAVRRRFGKDSTEADVIDYVADVRGRSEEIGDAIDPRAAEKLILAALNDEGGGDIDVRTRGRIYITFIGALVSDERLDDEGIEVFLAAARECADGALAE